MVRQLARAYGRAMDTLKKRPSRRTAAKSLAAAATGLGLLLSASGASAHNSHGWYWTERYADSRLANSYSIVVDADCIGWGTRKGRKYDHFFCGLQLDDGTGVEVTVEVLGRRRARVLYNDETDIIR
jgi:hypothetical protein